jgi:DNA-binding NtrC family response regulator
MNRILVVDDDRPIVKMQKQMLNRLGYDVEVFYNAMDALEKLKDSSSNFQLVITDYRMPQMNGLELYGELRSFSDIPVILCTGLGEVTPDEPGSKLYYLEKPIEMAGLKSLVEKLLA